MNATKEGEFADADMRAVAEEIAEENAQKETPESAPTPPEPAEPAPQVEEPAPAPQKPETKKEEDVPPPEGQRPVEGEEPWRKKQAEKVERRNEEKERYQKLEEEMNSVKQHLESVVTKDDLSEIKQLIAAQAAARTPTEKVEAKDDFETYISALNPESQEFAKKIADHVRKSTPQVPQEMADALKFFKEQTARQQQETAQMQAKKEWEAHFEKEFDAYARTHPEYQNAKEGLRNLYFSPKYEKWAVSEIAEMNAGTLIAPKKKTAESGGNVKSQELVLDLSTNEGKEKAAKDVVDNWENLDDKQLDQAIGALTTQPKKLIMNQSKII